MSPQEVPVDVTGRHRRQPPARWTLVIASALFGVALGASGAVIVDSDPHRPAPQAATTVAPSSVPAPPSETASSVEPPPGSRRAVGPVAFAEPAIGPAGLSLTVLPPEKVKGGVRLTIALVNTTGAPIAVDTGELGPHEPRFDGAVVPMTMTPAKKKLVPGEGYTYQCVIELPTMNLGQLALVLGAVTVTGPAAGD